MLKLEKSAPQQTEFSLPYTYQQGMRYLAKSKEYSIEKKQDCNRVKKIWFSSANVFYNFAGKSLLILRGWPKLRKHLDHIKKEKKDGWEHRIVKILRKSQHLSKNLEVWRLRRMGFLSLSREARLWWSIATVHLLKDSNPDTQKIKILMGNAQAIRDMLEERYDVFIHAQSTPWIVVPILIKECMKALYPEKPLHQFKFLRSLEYSDQSAIGNFTRKIFGKGAVMNWLFPEHESQNAKEFLKSTWLGPWDAFASHRELMISADAYLYNNQPYESSLFFLANNSNISGTKGKICSVVSRVIDEFGTHLSQGRKKNLVDKMVRQIPMNDKEGNLYTIAIPKKKSSEFQWRSHPFGVVCTCHKKSRNTFILQELQKGVLNESNRCTKHSCEIPQFRLYTPVLQPEKSVKIYLHSPISPYKRKKIKNVARQIGKEIASIKY